MSVINQATLAAARRDAMRITTVQVKNLKTKYDLIYNEDSTDEKNKIYQTDTGFGFPTSQGDGNSAAADTRRKLYTGTVTPTKYQVTYEVTELALETDVHGVIAKNQPLATKSIMAGREQRAMNVLNLGFTSGNNGFDGVILFSASHPTNGGANFSNTGTAAAWDYIAYKTMMANLRAQKDPRNIPFDFGEDQYYIVHPTAINTDVLTVIESQGVAGTDLNDKNVIGRLGVPMMSRYLTSTTAYFAIPVEKDAHGLRRLKQLPLKVGTFEDAANTGNMRVRLRESDSFFWEHPYNIYGNAGA